MEQKAASKKALLVLDIQNDFTGENAKMAVDTNQAKVMIANLNKIIDKAKENQLTVIYIGNEYSKFDVLNIFRNFASIKGTDGAKIDEKLHVVTNYYFSKQKENAFSNPELAAFLKQQNISELYIGGLYAEACIYSTIKSAIRHNYPITVLTDCIATKTEKKRTEMIEKYKKFGAKILMSDQL